MKRWLAVAVALAMAQSAWAEPIRLARANFSHRTPLAAAAVPTVPVPALGSVTVNVADQAVLKQTLRTEMLEFVQRNYPGHTAMAMRSIQKEEGRVHKELEKSIRFLEEFAQGPVTIGGAFREINGALRYVVTGTIRGVNGHPAATLRFETYPGFFLPVTDVALDEDGDGQTDEKSTAFCRLESVWDWVEARFPQRNHPARGLRS